MTFIIVTVMLDFLAFGIIAPVLPNLIKQFEGGDIARASDMTGYFGFAWNLMQFLFLPVLGAWSDRFGRRPVILISCLGLGLDYIFMAMAPSLRWLFVGRLDFGDYGVEYFDRVCVYHGYFGASRTREKIWDAGRGVWRGICGGAGGGRASGTIQFAGAVLGCGGVEHREFFLRYVCAAGIAAEGEAGEIGVASGESAGIVDAVAIASGAGEFVDRGDPLLPGAPGAAECVGAVHGISVWMEYSETVGIVAGAGGGVRGDCVRRTGGAVRKEIWRTIQFGERTVLWSVWDLWDSDWRGEAGESLAAIPFIALWGVAGPAMQSLMSQKVDASSQGKLQGAINSLRALTGMVGPVLFTQVFSAAIAAERAGCICRGRPIFWRRVLLVAALLMALVATRRRRGGSEVGRNVKRGAVVGEAELLRG